MNDTVTPTTSSAKFPTLRTLLRPRFWVGGSWKKEIAKSDMPSEIQSLLRQVVSKSRLTRREKFDVAEELIQHFQDGHEEGLSFDQLVSKFGDPQAAALLIRRSKLRSRGFFVHTLRMTAAAMACCFIPYLGMFGYYHYGQANPSVDYMAEFNRKVGGAAEEDKAWPLYRSMWTKYEFGEGAEGEYTEMRKQMWGDEDRSRLAQPADEHWPQVVEMLKQHRELLDVFRNVAKCKSHGLELQPNAWEYCDEDFAALFPGGSKEDYKPYYEEYDAHELFEDAAIATLLPHVQPMREAARLLYLDTRLAVLEGDSKRAAKNIETVIGLANQASATPTLVNTLVANAVDQIAINQLEEVLTENPDFFSEAELARLQATISATDIHSWLDYSGEKLFLKDVVQRCYTDDGNGDGRMTAAGMRFLRSDFFGVVAGLIGSSAQPTPIAQPSSFTRFVNWSEETWTSFVDSEFTKSALEPTSLITCASRKEVLAKAEELFQEVEDDGELPFWESRNSQRDGWKDFNDFFDENEQEHILLATLMPATQQVSISTERAVAINGAALIAIAAYRYRLQNEEWPKKASDLIPKFLGEIPVDVLTGKPLHFKIVDDLPLLYSVGLDHDDDGGVDATEDGQPIQRSFVSPGPRSDDFEGDWILWPQAE